MPVELTQKKPAETAVSAEVLARIVQSLEQLRYGSLEIVVHDGKVVQIERREKLRFGKP